VYGSQKAEKNFLAFAAYIMFFPKILAGPLERSHQFIEQIKKNISFSYEDFVIGLRFVLWGLFKKIVIADRLAPFVNQVFGNVYEYSGITLIVTIIFYLFQLYCDFSGYTEIAIGISKMLGFNLTPNFDRPFIAQSLTGLWKRWHISLSSWINDYLYTPIALQTRYWGKMGLITALVVSFLIIGAWHGGTWNYLIFGVLLSIGVVYEFLTLNIRKKLFKKFPDKFTFYFNVITVFIYFTFTLIFFRAENLKDAIYFVKHLFYFNVPLMNPLFFDKKLLPEIIFSFLSIIFLLSFEYNFKGDYICDRLTKGKKYYRWAVYLILANLILFFGVFGSDKFIYFQF
jgi:D-alanyl-lipoteichoic acid acyltransferase DltB (MBOAT superfamily)